MTRLPRDRSQPFSGHERRSPIGVLEQGVAQRHNSLLAHLLGGMDDAPAPRPRYAVGMDTSAILSGARAG
jgi:hypothetical protein